MKKTLRLIALFLLVSQVLVSCGEGKNGTTTDTTTDTQTTETEITEKDPNDDDLPEGLDFGGREYRVMTYKDGNLPTTNTAWPNYIEVESETGDLVNDAAYRRNREVEERLDVKIVCNELHDSEVVKAVRQSVMAQDDSFDMAVFWSGPQMLGLIQDGALIDVNSTEYIDLSKPYYSKSMTETYRFGESNYMFAGKYPYPQFASVYLLFNKDLFENYHFEDPYELVRSGKWTLDKFAEMVKGKYSDLNGDSKYDIDDMYGLSAFEIIYNYFYFSAGGYLVSADENGFTYGMNTEHSISIIEKLIALIDSEDTYAANPGDHKIRYKNFTDGHSLFCLYASSFYALRDIEFDFGILPLPKYDETQNEYITYQCSGICAIPSTISDTSYVSAVTEALFSTSAKTMNEPFIQKFVENKLLRDEGSQEMYRLLTETASYEVTRLIDPTNGICDDMKPITDLIMKRSTDVSSKWASISDTVIKAYDSLYDQLIK